MGGEQSERKVNGNCERLTLRPAPLTLITHRLSAVDAPRQRDPALVWRGRAVDLGPGGSVVGQVGQPPQRDVDPARHLLPLKVPDLAHGLGGEGVDQVERFVRVEVEERKYRSAVASCSST